MPLLPNFGPPLPATHQPIPPEKMMALAQALTEHAKGDPVTMAMVESVASAHDVQPAEVYAAMATNPNLVPHIEHETLLAICVGTCQLQGAVENLGKLIEARAERIAAGKTAFDIVPRVCLDMCPHSPVAISRSKHGQAAHPKVDPASVGELVGALCD